MFGPFFALETEPLAAQRLFSVGPLAVTNAMLFAVITAAFLISFLLLAAKMTRLYPNSRFAYYVELLVEGIWGTAESTFGNRKTALKHLPLLATLFTFILIGNLSGSGLLPGVGSVTAHTGNETVPLLRPFTTDLNATLAMAILTIGLVQFYALRQLGLKKHLKHYFAAVSSLAGNFGWIATVPTVLLEIFFSIIQAYVFMMLSATYLSVAVRGGDEHKENHQETAKQAS
jgi:F0F1-type ATP synthase membrane subunit a